jgi:hypothetical protein
MVAMMLKEGW